VINYPITAALALIVLAFFAHITGGLMESLSVRPAANGGASHADPDSVKIERSWVQLMCAFQLVSVDLVAVAIVLYLLAFTDHLMPAQSIAMGMSVLLMLWGISWLLQLSFLKRPSRDYLFLGHWSFWFLCSGLTYWGAQAL
jgi:hypothetical protein